MYTAALLIIDSFEALLSHIQFVYTYHTTVGCRESYVKHFDPNGLFVHILEVI